MLRFLLSLIMFSFCLKDQNDETNRTQKAHKLYFWSTQKKHSRKTEKNIKGHKKTAAYILIRAAAFISLP